VILVTTYGSTVPEHQSHVNLWLVAVIGLVAALVALGSWVLIDRYTGPEHDATTLIDDLNAAWSAGDAEAVATFFAPDAVMTRDDGQQTVGVDAISGLVPLTDASDFQVERVAPVTVEGDFATTFMKYTSVSAGGTEVGVFQLEEGKILRYWFFQLGATPPFDDAVMP
jgi:uncharacterized protein (TIGR02246 family)